MNLIKLSILWLSASQCLANIFEATSKKTGEPASLVEATAEILSSCYKKKGNAVGLAGTDSEGTLFETLSTKQIVSVAVIGSDTSATAVDRKSPQKLNIFVVTASSSKRLEHTLGQIKRSQWWNHMATFLILDWHSGTDQGCSNAFPFLWTAWNTNLLNVLYVCHHRTNGRQIYSFNPYTSQAPVPWQRENTFKGKNDHPWTLLRREYDGDERNCVNLDFDKTNDLGGYKIYSSVKEFLTLWIIDHTKTGVNSLGGIEGHLARAIFRALNATPHLIVHDSKIPGLNDRLGNDIAMDTVNGISDIVLNSRLYPLVLNYTVSRVYYENEVGILTQQSGQQSQLEKLVSLIDRSSRFCVCLVAVITGIFFKYFLRQPIGTAALNVFRIVTNSSLTKVPKNQAARFFLAGVFSLVVTIVGIYQGKLASLLTKSKAAPDVETMQDLADRGYTIHGNRLYAHLFSDPAFKDHFVNHDDPDCVQYVVRDPSAACVLPRSPLINAAAKFKLHVSRDRALKTFTVFVIREDWPLEERFNKVLKALTESGVTSRIVLSKTSLTLSIAKYYEVEEEKDKFKVIILNELTFAFAILGIGLAFATVSFVVEVAVSRPR